MKSVLYYIKYTKKSGGSNYLYGAGQIDTGQMMLADVCINLIYLSAHV